jgi:hypothetical protein
MTKHLSQCHNQGEFGGSDSETAEIVGLKGAPDVCDSAIRVILSQKQGDD